MSVLQTQLRTQQQTQLVVAKRIDRIAHAIQLALTSGYVYVWWDGDGGMFVFLLFSVAQES